MRVRLSVRVMYSESLVKCVCNVLWDSLSVFVMYHMSLSECLCNIPCESMSV